MTGPVARLPPSRTIDSSEPADHGHPKAGVEHVVPVTPTALIQSYHAHIYFADAAQRQHAGAIREDIGRLFDVRLGRWHEQPIGPHQRPMYQVAFSVETFTKLIPWLMLNRNGLAVLVHPNTMQPRRDHLVHAMWLGEMLTIVRPEQLPEQTEGVG